MLQVLVQLVMQTRKKLCDEDERTLMSTDKDAEKIISFLLAGSERDKVCMASLILLLCESLSFRLLSQGLEHIYLCNCFRASVRWQ